MGIGETGVGEMGVGETGPNRPMWGSNPGPFDSKSDALP